MRLLCDMLAMPLGERVASLLGTHLVKRTMRLFPDGEADIALQESIEHEDVFVLSSATSTSWMPLLLLLDALVRSRPQRIYLCFAYFGYGRQDRQMAPCGCFPVRRLAMLLGTFPLERIFITDLHNLHNIFLFPMPCLSMSSSKIFYSYLIERNAVPDIFVAPDLGAISRARQLAALCARPWCFLDKKAAAQKENNRLQGKRCVLIDDLVDSGRTLCHAATVLRREGAQSIMAFATHGLFANKEYRREIDSLLEELIVTDTLPLSPEAPVIAQQITIAPLIKELFESLCNK
ncbi:MAG: ribose-phosphate diphosphokinase [Holosporales bacterium]|jgi:ribose-phosphate pyrophosphokinase|nr:ribose-phosphate diphosphokinase [Holosporales bacterium]